MQALKYKKSQKKKKKEITVVYPGLEDCNVNTEIRVFLFLWYKYNRELLEWACITLHSLQEVFLRPLILLKNSLFQLDHVVLWDQILMTEADLDSAIIIWLHLWKFVKVLTVKLLKACLCVRISVCLGISVCVYTLI